MNKLFYFIFLFIACAIFVAIFSSCQRHELSPAVKTVNKAMERNANFLAKKYHMNPIGVGISMPDSEIQWLDLEFQVFSPLSKAELRRILIESSKDFFLDLQSDTLLCSYLKNPPLSMENVKIMLFVYDTCGQGVYLPEIGIAGISKGVLFYWKRENTNFAPIKSEEEETYEEALRALREPSTALESPCDSEVVQPKPVWPDVRGERDG